MHFEFATAQRILFGVGSLREVGPMASTMGSCALVVTGRSTARAEGLAAVLAAQGLRVTWWPVAGEPSTDVVSQGVERAREAGCDLVIGFGGGSALDAAKAIAALLTNPGHLLDYLEVIGGGKPLTGPAAPCIAVPTTAGTGTEVTRNAVLVSPERRVKVSLRGPGMLPRVAVVDPALCHGLPPAITATTGLDALTQLIEPFVCLRANPLTDGYCLEGMRRVARALRLAWAQPQHAAAREDMSLASLLGGLALANAGLGAVHGLAAPIGGQFTAPHGAVCAALLPHVMAVNVRALRRRQPGSERLERYQRIARVLTGQPEATLEQGLDWVRGLCQDLAIHGLRHYGLAPAHWAGLVEKASQASSMKANPIPLTCEEMEEILTLAL